MGHKASLSKFKKIEILSSIFSDHNAIRLEIEYKKNVKKRIRLEIEYKKNVKKRITWRLNNMSLNNRSLKKSNREQKITYKEMKTKAWLSKTSRKKQKPFKEESYSNTILPQETIKTLNRQPNFTKIY